MDTNRVLCSLLMQGFGKGNVDAIEEITGSTPLTKACELLTDLSIIRMFVENDACVNAVDCKDRMPLSIIKARIKEDPDNFDLQDIYDYLKRNGAVKDWHKLTKKNMV